MKVRYLLSVRQSESGTKKIENGKLNARHRRLQVVETGIRIVAVSARRPPRFTPQVQLGSQVLPGLPGARAQRQTVFSPQPRCQPRDHPRRVHHDQVRRGPAPTAGPCSRPGAGGSCLGGVSPTERVLGEGQVMPVGELAAVRVERYGVMRRRLLPGPADPAQELTAVVAVHPPDLPHPTFAAASAFFVATSEARRGVGSSRPRTQKGIAWKPDIEEQ